MKEVQLSIKMLISQLKKTVFGELKSEESLMEAEKGALKLRDDISQLSPESKSFPAGGCGYNDTKIQDLNEERESILNMRTLEQYRTDVIA